MAPPFDGTVIGNLFQAVVAALALYTVYYVYWQFTTGVSRRRMIKDNGCKPIRSSPELNSWVDSVIGWKLIAENAKAFKEHRLLEHIRGRFQRNGYTFYTRMLTTDIYVTAEPENLKAMLALKFKDWSLPDSRKAAFLPVLGPGIFTNDGAAWHRSRDLLRPNFVRSQVDDLQTFEAHVSHLIQAIPRDGSTVDIEDLFFRLTIDSATEFLYGESTNVLTPRTSGDEGQKFAKAWNESQELITTRFRNGALWSWIRGSKFRKDTQYVHGFVDSYVERALEYRKTLNLSEKSDLKEEGRYVFLYELAKATNDPEQIRSELLNILIAGRDTTASLLSNVWFVLAQRPDIWKKLRAEVEELGGDKPTFAQIKNMKYLRYILNESLRLHPVVPSNARMSVVDTVLPLGGGPDGKAPLFIPARTNVEYSVFTMHRRNDFYGEDADEFKPERWETLRPGWEYLPFNGGPRICIGQQLALTEASYTTIRLMQEFKSVESREPGPWEEWLTLTCAANGAKVALTPANPIRPTPRCYASFTVTDFAKTRTNSATAAIPPATFSSLPPADRRLLRRHTKLLWALSAGFFVCVIILTVSIVLAATEAKAPGGRVKWSVVVIGILGFVGAAVCVAFGWDAYRGRKARAERQETWVELEAESEERTRRERRRQRDVILDIRSRQQTPSLTRARPQSRGRARERDEEMGPGHRPQEITTIHKTHPSPSPNPNHLRRPYTRQNSISHPDPPNLNLKLDLDLTPFSRPSCDRLLATEREKQRLAQQAAQEMLSLYAQSAASAHNTASSLAHPSPNSTGHATSSPSPYSAPTDPWKIDIVPPRPGPRIQHRSAFRTPSSATPAENPFATPPPSESHGTAPPHHGPIIPTPTHHHHGHLFAMLALSTSPAADEACSETASVRERMRKQSVDRVQRWRARNEEMEGEGRDGEGEGSAGRAIRRVEGVVGLRGVLKRFQSS